MPYCALVIMFYHVKIACYHITPSYQEHMIILSSMKEKTYLQGFLEGVLEAIQVSSLKLYPHSLWMVGSPLQSSSPREKEKK